jgi:Skp family chaperone for outer membrane proteins
MKKIILCASVLTLISAFTSVEVKAEGTERFSPAVVAVVDMQKLQEKSTAYQGLMTQKDKLLAEIKAEAAKDEANLHSLEEKIAKEKSTMTQEELAKKTEDFRQKVIDFQQKYKTKEEELFKVIMDANLKIQEKAFNPAMESLIKNNKIDVVLASNQAVFFKPTLNITDEIVALMNDKLPKVEVAPLASDKKTKDDKKSSAKKK